MLLHELAGGERGEVGAVPFAGVVDGEAGGAEGGEEAGDVGDGGARVVDGVSEVRDVALFRTNWQGKGIRVSWCSG